MRRKAIKSRKRGLIMNSTLTRTGRRIILKMLHQRRCKSQFSVYRSCTLVGERFPTLTTKLSLSVRRPVQDVLANTQLYFPPPEITELQFAAGQVADSMSGTQFSNSRVSEIRSRLKGLLLIWRAEIEEY